MVQEPSLEKPLDIWCQELLVFLPIFVQVISETREEGPQWENLVEIPANKEFFIIIF
jgi:hypothetical protein